MWVEWLVVVVEPNFSVGHQCWIIQSWMDNKSQFVMSCVVIHSAIGVELHLVHAVLCNK